MNGRRVVSLRPKPLRPISRASSAGDLEFTIMLVHNIQDLTFFSQALFLHLYRTEGGLLSYFDSTVFTILGNPTWRTA